MLEYLENGEERAGAEEHSLENYLQSQDSFRWCWKAWHGIAALVKWIVNLSTSCLTPLVELYQYAWRKTFKQHDQLSQYNPVAAA